MPKVQSQDLKATDASEPSDLKKPKQLKLQTWKKVSDSWWLMQLASLEAEELTGGCWKCKLVEWWKKITKSGVGGLFP